MTPDEIKELPASDLTEMDESVMGIAQICYWLKEIAYQLAILNEREGSHDTGDGCMGVKIVS
jgi:hypothetical protein